MRHGVLLGNTELVEKSRLELMDSIHELDDIMTKLISEDANFKPLVLFLTLF